MIEVKHIRRCDGCPDAEMRAEIIKNHGIRIYCVKLDECRSGEEDIEETTLSKEAEDIVVHEIREKANRMIEQIMYGEGFDRT